MIIFQKPNKIEHILDGTIVLIVTSKEIIVKRLRIDQDSNSLLLEGDNESKEENMRLKKDDVRLATMVRGKISSVLVPHHEITLKGKIQAMEEAIKFLKKELFL